MPAYGVTLSGTLAAPTIENHSGKTILAYTVKFLEANGGGPTYSGDFGKTGLADGRKGDVADPNSSLSVFERVQFHHTDRPLIKAALLNVVFADGEFVGADDGGGRFCAAIGQGSDFVLDYIVDSVAEVLGIDLRQPAREHCQFPIFNALRDRLKITRGITVWKK
jgi:hypothetical protein